MSAADADGAGAPRFGVRLGEVPVLLPAGAALEFVAGATLYPLPLAPRRVAGLMQLRGHPLVVIDPQTRPADAPPPARRDVLVVGVPPDAAALVVQAPPQAVTPAGERPAMVPDCSFAAALLRSLGDVQGATVWYEVDATRLFSALVAA